MSKLLKFMVTCVTCTLFLFLMGTTTIVAENPGFNELPTKKTSKQWSVLLGEARQGKDLVNPQKGKFETYSLNVENIGKDVESAEIYMFGNTPNSSTMYSLFGCPDGMGKDCEVSMSLDGGKSALFENFTFAEKYTLLEVVILWTEKGSNGRTLKETFTFTE